jgi:hypothetical protein
MMERSTGQLMVLDAVSVIGTRSVDFAQKQSKVATSAALCQTPLSGYKTGMPDSGEIRHS